MHTIAISHPHYYSGMVEWAERLDARVLLHEADRALGDAAEPADRVLVGRAPARSATASSCTRLGGHFEGGTVCLWRDGAGGRGALLSGDIVQVVADRGWVSFMRSYPNLIPLPAAEVTRIRGIVETLAFDRVYGAWWDAVVPDDARAKVLRSADRYVRALGLASPRLGDRAERDRECADRQRHQAVGLIARLPVMPSGSAITTATR